MANNISKLILILGALTVNSLVDAKSSDDFPTSEDLLEDGKPRGLPLDENDNEKLFAGWTVHFDNDLLIPGSGRDQDYTGGLGITLTGRYAKDTWWSLDPVLDTAGQFVGLNDYLAQANYFQLHAIQAGLLVFSPSDIGSDSAIYDDRPFANLLYLSNSRRNIVDPLKSVYQSTFTLGILGSKIGSEMQNSIHDITGSDAPNGWDHQISDGGELTFQYSFAKQSLLTSNFQTANTEYEIKYTTGASVGYISEANIALTARWGLINTPWWSFTPENADYASHPAPVIGDSTRSNVSEFYVWGGVKLRARAYNAFLQGQFRDSEVTFASDELNHFLGEAWIGITKQISNYRLSYVIRYQTKEIKHGAGARDPLWAGLIFSVDY